MRKITPNYIAVANYIIERINKYNSDKKLLKEQVILHTKKLQKLIYFCDIEYMKRNNGLSLFSDEYNAWPTGPVIDGVFNLYGIFSGNTMQPILEYEKVELSEDIKFIIDEVLDRIMHMDTIDLVNASCIEYGPWDQVYNEIDKSHNQIISKEQMYSFYKNRDIISGKQDLSLLKK